LVKVGEGMSDPPPLPFSSSSSLPPFSAPTLFPFHPPPLLLSYTIPTPPHNNPSSPLVYLAPNLLARVPNLLCIPSLNTSHLSQSHQHSSIVNFHTPKGDMRGIEKWGQGLLGELDLCFRQHSGDLILFSFPSELSASRALQWPSPSFKEASLFIQMEQSLRCPH
ncbi:hypothetical protein AMTR_s00124p00016700, partial [Amborella trichopoda]